MLLSHKTWILCYKFALEFRVSVWLPEKLYSQGRSLTLVCQLWITKHGFTCFILACYAHNISPKHENIIIFGMPSLHLFKFLMFIKSLYVWLSQVPLWIATYNTLALHVPATRNGDKLFIHKCHLFWSSYSPTSLSLVAMKHNLECGTGKDSGQKTVSI